MKLLLSRCIDQWGYCTSPNTPELVTTPQGRTTPSIVVIANCKHDPATCKHHCTLSQTLEPLRAGASERTG